MEALGRLTAEVAFYNALANNLSAHDLMGDLMGDTVLMQMQRLRRIIKSLLQRYKDLPGQGAAAIEVVLPLTESIGEEWFGEDVGQ